MPIAIILLFFFYLQRPEEDSYFTSKGLKPTMADLDNLFDDSGDEPDMVSVYS